MSDEYTIITYIRGKKYYWRKRNGKANSGGVWGAFPGATIFSADERAKYPLPHEGAWVSVLHGMGSSKYAADSELTTSLTLGGELAASGTGASELNSRS